MPADRGGGEAVETRKFSRSCSTKRVPRVAAAEAAPSLIRLRAVPWTFAKTLAEDEQSRGALGARTDSEEWEARDMSHLLGGQSTRTTASF